MGSWTRESITKEIMQQNLGMRQFLQFNCICITIETLLSVRANMHGGSVLLQFPESQKFCRILFHKLFLRIIAHYCHITLIQEVVISKIRNHHFNAFSLHVRLQEILKKVSTKNRQPNIATVNLELCRAHVSLLMQYTFILFFVCSYACTWRCKYCPKTSSLNHHCTTFIL